MKVVFVGLGGIPSGKRAIDVRIDALAKLTVKAGYSVEVINRFSKIMASTDARYNVYDPFSSTKSASWGRLRFLIYYTVSLLQEPYVIFKSNKKEKIGIIVTSSGHFVDILVYRIICYLIGAKLVYEYCEYRSAINRKCLYHYFNGKLVDRVSPRLWDGAICISHFLEDACKKVNPCVRTTIVYPLCDFADYERINAIREGFNYIMFCGSVEYEETLDLILESYKLSTIEETHKLLLVLRGDQRKIQKISKEKNVVVKTDLSYESLVGYLKGARALLIPVNNTIRDIARFPNKICEYGAVGGLIITVNNGEMKYVFTDKKNALMAKSFSASCFARELNELNPSSNSFNLNSIREAGASTCKMMFDLESNLKKVAEFYNCLFHVS